MCTLQYILHNYPPLIALQEHSQCSEPREEFVTGTFPMEALGLKVEICK